MQALQQMPERRDREQGVHETKKHQVYPWKGHEWLKKSFYRASKTHSNRSNNRSYKQYKSEKNNKKESLKVVIKTFFDCIR